MVALAVGSILVLSLYAVLFSVSRAGSGVAADLDRRIEAGRLLDRLSGDLHSAYLSGGQETFFEGLFKAGSSALTLTAFSRLPVADSSPSTDISGVSYFVERSEEGLIVYREAWNPYIGERFRSEMISGAEQFELSYFNGKAWSKAWDASIEGRLPVAVRARLVLKGGAEFTSLARTMIK